MTCLSSVMRLESNFPELDFLPLSDGTVKSKILWPVCGKGCKEFAVLLWQAVLT